MPIVYQPAQPLAPDISSRYGAAEQSYRDIPQILEARRMQIAQQTQQDAAARAGQEHAAALAQQGAQFRAGLQQNAYDQISNRNLAGAEFQAHLDQAPQLAQQHAELAAWVNNQEMTQADNMRLQRLQSALSSVMGDDTLTTQQKSDYAMELRTGIDPLKRRAEESRQRLEEEQIKHAITTNQMQDKITQARNDFFAGNIDKLPVVVDPVTGKPHRMLIDHNGQLYDPFKGARADKPPVEKFDEKAVIEQAKVEAAAAVPEDEKDLTTGKIGRSVKNQTEYNQKLYDVLRRMAHDHAKAHGTTPMLPAPGSGDTAPTAPLPSPVSPGGSVPDRVAPAEQKKFNPQTLEDATPEQKNQVAIFQSIKQTIADHPNLPPVAKLAYTTAANKAIALLADHGSRAKMAGVDAADFDAAMLVLRRLANESAPAPPVGNTPPPQFALPPGFNRGPAPVTPIE